jgi:hypothetical protein
MLGSADAMTNEASASMCHTYRRGAEQIGLLPRVAESLRQKNGSLQACCVNSACMHAFQYFAADLGYRVRARNARIRVMHGQHRKQSIENEAVEPPVIIIIAGYSSGVVS